MALLVGVALLAGGHSAQAGTGNDTWQGSAGSTDWATPGDWTTGSANKPPATGDSLIFTSANASSSATLTNSLTTSAFNIGTITFNAGAIAYTMTGNTFTLTSGITNSSSNLQTFSNTGGLSTSSATETFNVSSSGGIAITTGLINTDAGAQTLTVNGAGGLLTLGGYTLENSGSTARTDVINGTGNVAINGAVVNGTAATGSGLTYSGSGTLTLSASSSYTGGTGVTSGTLALDFSAAGAPTTNIVSSSSALTLGGGTLNINGKGSATNSQAFASTTLTGNTSSILSFTQNSATSLGATLGGLTRNGGSTVDITLPTTGSVSTTSTTFVSNSVLVSAATNGIAFGTSGGTTWLTNSSGTLGALSTYATGTGNYTSANNVDVTNGDSVSGVTVNTLRFNAASDALTLAGTNVVATGGILATSAGTGSSISGGTLTSGGGKELVIIDNGSLNVGSVIANNTGGASALTLAGAGSTTLSGANTYTGATAIDAGTVILGVSQVGTTSGAFGTGSSALTVASGVTLNLNGNNVSVGGTTFNTGAGTTTLTSATAGTLTVGNGSSAINLSGLSTITGAASLTIAGGPGGSSTFASSSTTSPTFTSTSTGTLTFQNQTSQAGRFNNLATDLGSSMTLAFNGNGQFTTGAGSGAPTVTLASGNKISVTGTGNAWGYQTTTTIPGAVTGSGTLTFYNGFNPVVNFTGNLSAFTGTLGLLGSGSNQAFQFTNTTNFGGSSASANWTLNSAAPTTAANTLSYFNYTGAGNDTLALGSLSGAVTAGTGAGAGFSGYGVLSDSTAATTATWQIGSANATTTFAGVIQNGSGTSALSVVGSTGNLTLSGTNTYTGATLISGGTLTLAATKTLGSTSGITVSAGTLSLTATNALNTPVVPLTTSTTPGTPGTTSTVQVPITLAGGTLLRTGTNVYLGSGTTVGAGALTLTAASTLDFGTGSVGTLNFNSFVDTGNSLLTVADYTSTYSSTTTVGAGTDGTDDRLIFNEPLTPTQLADISFGVGETTSQVELTNGEYEITAVPEPATWAAGLLSLGALGLGLRRRLLRTIRQPSAV